MPGNQLFNIPGSREGISCFIVGKYYQRFIPAKAREKIRKLFDSEYR